MIQYVEGDIFSSPAQVIVNTVNTVGVMGKGIALEFKTRYPKMFEKYKEACEKKKFQIGKLMLYNEIDHLILLFPTKENWRNPSRIEYIEKGLDKFVKCYAEKNITSIAFPKLGCGNGELDWKDVKLVMEKYLKSLPIDVYIYLRNNNEEKPEHKQSKEMQKWLRDNAKDMSFNGLVDDIRLMTAMMPYNFKYNNVTANATFQNSLKLECGSVVYELTEEEFFKQWDFIRTHNMFEAKNDNCDMLYEMLLSLGYLSRVKIVNKDSTNNGYQLNGGLGRMFISKEV